VTRPTSLPTSLSLLRRARDNDQLAWEQIVHLYGPMVHRWCRRAGLKDQDTADVFQETFRAVAAHLETFQPQRSVGSFRSWLRSITRTKVVDHFRRLKRQPPGEGGSDAHMRWANVPDPLADDDVEEAASEEALVVRRALDLIRPQFSDHNWQAFMRVAVHGEAAVDVAKTIGVSAQAVRQANYRIRRRLRDVLLDMIDNADVTLAV